MWDINQKATNEQTKLTDIDNSIMGTKGAGVTEEGEGGQIYMVMDRGYILSDEHTMQYTDDIL